MRLTSIAILILMVHSICSFGQGQRVPYENFNYDYIETDSVLLKQYGDSVYLFSFYDKLSMLTFEGKGNIKIIHFGASHIQAGIWPWQTRSNFEGMSISTEGGPGFVFPFSIEKTNHPYYYRSSSIGNWETVKITDKDVNCPIGIGGITAVCADSLAEIEILFNKAALIDTHAFDKISVFYGDKQGSYHVSVIPESNVKYYYHDAQAGTTVFYLNEASDSLNLLFERTSDDCDTLFFYGAYLEKQSNGINYCGIGINGASTSSYFKSSLLQQHLCTIDPDMVIFSIGVNDASGKNFSADRYASNYSYLIKTIREACPAVAIVLTTNSDFYYYRGAHNEHAPEVLSAMNKVASQFGASVWDMHAAMGGNRSINLWKRDGLAQRDRIHFSQEGYTILGRLLFEAIQKDYENYLYRNSSKSANK